jgi:branched-chain amino acid transport system substrate-binding protein
MLKRLGAIAVITAAVAALVAATLGGTASAKVANSPLCKKAGLGYAGPLTGNAKFLGDDQSNWEKLFISSWNAGKAIPGVPKSLHRVKLNLAIAGDSQLNPDVAANVARQMVANKTILGMVGFAGSNENLGGGPVLDRAHLGYVSGSATLDTLATGTNSTKPLKDFYRVVPQNAQQARSGVPYIIKTLKLKKNDKVLIVDDGEAYGIGLANDAQKLFQKAGLKVTRDTVNESSTPNASFGAQIQVEATKAAAGSYKLVYAPTQVASDSQTFDQDLQTASYTGGFMATDGSVDPSHFNTPGAYISFFGPSITKITKAYRDAYKAKYGATSANDPFGAPSFVATQMLGVAISEACSAGLSTKLSTARAQVVSKLKHVSQSTTILGYSMAFNNKADAYHGPSSGVTVFKIQGDGSYKQVSP